MLKNNFILKITNIIRNFFIKKNKTIMMLDEKKNIDNETFLDTKNEIDTENTKGKKFEDEKKEFFRLYNESKKDNFDVFSVDKEKLDKICDMMLEEIKIKQKYIEELKAKLNNVVN